MTRALLVLRRDADRSKAVTRVTSAPVGTRIEFKAPRRTLPQNDRMWAMLSDIAQQKEHCGRKYSPDEWKILMLHACGREVRFLPALDGKTFVPWGQSSSDLSKEEMSELIDFMAAWGAENGVEFYGSARTREAVA